MSQSARMGAAKAGRWYLDRGCGVLVIGVDWGLGSMVMAASGRRTVGPEIQ